jgi:glycine oxidase
VSSPDVIVIGAGVLGLCAAAELASRGHAVTVIDPGGDNASSVAAGMIAPAFESLLDDLSPDRAALLKRARDLWPAFAAAHGLTLHREGAEWRGPDADTIAARLHALGFDAVRTGEGVVAPDDWRVDPVAALAALGRTSGVDRVTGKVIRVDADDDGWWASVDDGVVRRARSLVVAIGVDRAPSGLPKPVSDRIETIQPIRGQLTHVAFGPPSRVLRAPKVYVAPTTSGVVVGASMELGRRDMEPDYDEAAARVALALSLVGPAGQVGPTRVGVRGATPDGLPMAGPSGAPGLFLALAPRRNGWLLGPLVGRVVADGIEGEAPLADAAALDPLRFA